MSPEDKFSFGYRDIMILTLTHNGLIRCVFRKLNFLQRNQNSLEDQIVFEKQTSIAREDMYSMFYTVFNFFSEKLSYNLLNTLSFIKCSRKIILKKKNDFREHFSWTFRRRLYLKSL